MESLLNKTDKLSNRFTVCAARKEKLPASVNNMKEVVEGKLMDFALDQVRLSRKEYNAS